MTVKTSRSNREVRRFGVDRLASVTTCMGIDPGPSEHGVFILRSDGNMLEEWKHYSPKFPFATACPRVADFEMCTSTTGGLYDLIRSLGDVDLLTIEGITPYGNVFGNELLRTIENVISIYYVACKAHTGPIEDGNPKAIQIVSRKQLAANITAPNANDRIVNLRMKSIVPQLDQRMQGLNSHTRAAAAAALGGVLEELKPRTKTKSKMHDEVVRILRGDARRVQG